MNPIFKRVTAALGAGAFGQVSNIAMQLFSLPIFLHYWSIEKYGLWLVFTAIPGYISMADVGMVQASGNKMTMEVSRSNNTKAQEVFHSAIVFMTITCAMVAILSAGILILLPERISFGVSEKFTVFALVLSVMIALFGGLSESLFKATNRYATGTMLGNLSRLTEWGGWIAGLALTGTFIGVACTGLAVRTACTVILIFLSNNNSYGIKWGVRLASSTEIRATIKPALSFMTFPLSSALSFQGITLLAAFFFGTAQVVVFNTYRTLARSAVQITGVFSNALSAEFAKLYSQPSREAIKEIYKKAERIGFSISIAFGAGLFIFSPTILELWTHNRVPLQWDLLALLIIYAVIGGAWHVPRVLLTSTNHHIELSKWVALTAALSFVLAYIFGENIGITGLGLAMLVSEGALALICLRLTRSFLN